MINGAPILTRDQDVVVLGDYNTMGREEAPFLLAAEERETLDQDLALGFRRLLMMPDCTEYFAGKAGALDHIVVSVGMQEAGTTARITGYCAVRCAAMAGTMPAAHERLSYHCPVVFAVRDEDLN